MHTSINASPGKDRSTVTTAPAAPRTLYGPDGLALTHSRTPATEEPAVAIGDWTPVRASGNATVWERPRMEPTIDVQTEADEILEAARRQAGQILTSAQTEAQRVADEAQRQAEWTREETQGLRARKLAAASTEAKDIRGRALEETAKEQKAKDGLDKWMARAAIAGAVGLTASGEYLLARLVGFPGQVAWLLPFVIDIYVIQAFRRHRDIIHAIVLGTAANVIYHLADAQLFGVTVAGGETHPKWWLIAMVASIASFILWRMHVITAPQDESPKRRRWRRRGGVESAPVESGATALTATESRPDSELIERVRVAGESTDESAVERARESTGESAFESGGERARESGADSHGDQQEHSHGGSQRSGREPSHRRSQRRRESAAKVPAIATPESEVDALITLMRQRGNPDKVTLKDAKNVAAGRSEATAARRLQAARAQYANTN